MLFRGKSQLNSSLNTKGVLSSITFELKAGLSIMRLFDVLQNI